VPYPEGGPGITPGTFVGPASPPAAIAPFRSGAFQPDAGARFGAGAAGPSVDDNQVNDIIRRVMGGIGQ
jgi:hypothetical protein